MSQISKISINGTEYNLSEKLSSYYVAYSEPALPEPGDSVETAIAKFHTDFLLIGENIEEMVSEALQLSNHYNAYDYGYNNVVPPEPGDSIETAIAKLHTYVGIISEFTMESTRLSEDYTAYSYSSSLGVEPQPNDSIELAISKLHKAIIDDEYAIASSLIDLNNKSFHILYLDYNNNSYTLYDKNNNEIPLDGSINIYTYVNDHSIIKYYNTGKMYYPVIEYNKFISIDDQNIYWIEITDGQQGDYIIQTGQQPLESKFINSTAYNISQADITNWNNSSYLSSYYESYSYSLPVAGDSIEDAISKLHGNLNELENEINNNIGKTYYLLKDANDAFLISSSENVADEISDYSILGKNDIILYNANVLGVLTTLAFKFAFDVFGDSENPNDVTDKYFMVNVPADENPMNILHTLAVKIDDHHINYESELILAQNLYVNANNILVNAITQESVDYNDITYDDIILDPGSGNEVYLYKPVRLEPYVSNGYHIFVCVAENNVIKYIKVTRNTDSSAGPIGMAVIQKIEGSSNGKIYYVNNNNNTYTITDENNTTVTDYSVITENDYLIEHDNDINIDKKYSFISSEVFPGLEGMDSHYLIFANVNYNGIDSIENIEYFLVSYRDYSSYKNIQKITPSGGYKQYQLNYDDNNERYYISNVGDLAEINDYTVINPNDTIIYNVDDDIIGSNVTKVFSCVYNFIYNNDENNIYKQFICITDMNNGMLGSYIPMYIYDTIEINTVADNNVYTYNTKYTSSYTYNSKFYIINNNTLIDPLTGEEVDFFSLSSPNSMIVETFSSELGGESQLYRPVNQFGSNSSAIDNTMLFSTILNDGTIKYINVKYSDISGETTIERFELKNSKIYYVVKDTNNKLVISTSYDSSDTSKYLTNYTVIGSDDIIIDATGFDNIAYRYVNDSMGIENIHWLYFTAITSFNEYQSDINYNSLTIETSQKNVKLSSVGSTVSKILSVDNSNSILFSNINGDYNIEFDNISKTDVLTYNDLEYRLYQYNYNTCYFSTFDKDNNSIKYLTLSKYDSGIEKDERGNTYKYARLISETEAPLGGITSLSSYYTAYDIFNPVIPTAGDSIETAIAKLHGIAGTLEYGFGEALSYKASTSDAIGSLSLSMNSSTYVISLSGTKVDGTSFTVNNAIDLPLESVVVDGEYNSSTKKVILTLKSGSTVEFSIADLINGLQSEITSSNKLSADLISDGTTNKTVTQTEKNAWNNKLDSFTETDPTVASYIKSITQSDISNWNSKTSYVGTINEIIMNGVSVPVSQSGSVDLGYNKDPLIIETSIENNTVPSGTYNNITIALNAGRQVILRVLMDPEWMKYIYVPIKLDNVYDGFNYVFGDVEYIGEYYSFYIGSNNSLSHSSIGFASDNHHHGLINNDGTITSYTTVANGDKIVIIDVDDGNTEDPLYNQINSSTITFDGSTTTTALTPKGTWEPFIKTETDPTVASYIKSITQSDISNWNSKTSNVGTITGITMNSASKGTSGVVDLGTVVVSETDPTVASYIKAITQSDITNWNNKLSTAPVTSVNGQTGAVNLTIPTVSDSTVTITMNGNTVGTFTLNKSGNTTIDLGTVLTSHQSIKTVNNQSLTGTGNISIPGLPTVTSSDNGKILMVVDGAWTLVNPVTLYSGSGTPSNSQGNNGDLYVQS